MVTSLTNKPFKISGSFLQLNEQNLINFNFSIQVYDFIDRKIY